MTSADSLITTTTLYTKKSSITDLIVKDLISAIKGRITDRSLVGTMTS
jgi:hypothetical protein